MDELNEGTQVPSFFQYSLQVQDNTNMLDPKLIQSLIDERIAELDNGLYVVYLRISPTNVIP